MPVDMVAVRAACTSRLQGEVDMLKFLGFLREEKGATAVEYALIIALVAAVLLGAMSTFGADIETIFGNIGDALSTAAGDSGSGDDSGT